MSHILRPLKTPFPTHSLDIFLSKWIQTPQSLFICYDQGWRYLVILLLLMCFIKPFPSLREVGLITNPTVFPCLAAVLDVPIYFSFALAQHFSAGLFWFPSFTPIWSLLFFFTRRTKEFRKPGSCSEESLFSLLPLLFPPTAPAYLCSSGGVKKKKKCCVHG